MTVMRQTKIFCSCLMHLISLILFVSTDIVISCPPNVVQQINCGVTSSQISFQAATATDGTAGIPAIAYSALGVGQFTPQNNNQVLATFNSGTTTVTATATNAGRSVTCTFTVTLNALGKSISVQDHSP